MRATCCAMSLRVLVHRTPRLARCKPAAYEPFRSACTIDYAVTAKRVNGSQRSYIGSDWRLLECTADAESKLLSSGYMTDVKYVGE